MTTKRKKEGVLEWRHEQEPKASSEEISYHDPMSLSPSQHTKPPHAFIFLVGTTSGRRPGEEWRKWTKGGAEVRARSEGGAKG
jgi:hypothetical protein